MEALADRQQAIEVLRHLANVTESAEISDEEVNRIRESLGLSAVFDATYLFHQLEELENLPAFDVSFGSTQMTLGAITAVGSAGYILWMLRGGVLVAAALAQLPGWSSFDPLPLLDSFERDPKKRDETDIQGFFGG